MPMTRVLVFRHGEGSRLGLLGEVLDASGLEVDEVALDEGDRIPDLDGYSALVVLGGAMGAYDEDEFPWLRDEKRAIQEAHRRGLPMLGLCLGAQLFADALGGSAYLANGPPEVGHLEPALNEDGRADPVIGQLDRPVVVFHQDTFDPPPGSTVLARTERFPHAFRCGSVVGIQAHPEADSGVVGQWVARDSARERMAAAGVDPNALLEQVAQGEADQREMAQRLFGAWIEEVTGRRSAVTSQTDPA